jgi:hypothetical protein
MIFSSTSAWMENQTSGFLSATYGVESLRYRVGILRRLKTDSHGLLSRTRGEEIDHT